MTAAEAFPRVEKLLRFFARLYTRHRPWFRGDLYQESVCQFFAWFDEFDGNPRHLPRFVRWTCLRAARRTFRQGSRWAAAITHPPRRLPDNRFCPAAEAPAPDFVRAEVIAAVRAAVDTLPPGSRRIIVRCYGLDGEPPATNRQLAGERGCTHQAISHHRRRALARLAAGLAGREGGGL